MKQLTLGLLYALFVTNIVADEKSTLTTENDKISYSIGFQVGGDLKRQGVAPNAEALKQGIRDAIASQSSQMTSDEMRTTLVNLKKKILAEAEKQRNQQNDIKREKGKQFLAENAKQKDVVSLPSGLQYKILRSGIGKSPKTTDEVTVHYIGKLIDGQEFDSSLTTNKPATFPVNAVISGWTEALQLMKEGDKWQLFIPPELGYGENGPLADQTLVFEVELLSVNVL